MRVRVRAADHYPRDAGREDGVGAGWRAAAVVAGLERRIERRASGGVTRLVERDDLRVILPGALVTSFASDAARLHDDRAHVRIGGRASTARQVESAIHERFIGRRG
jgi:hypothetical protein